MIVGEGLLPYLPPPPPPLFLKCDLEELERPVVYRSRFLVAHGWVDVFFFFLSQVVVCNCRLKSIYGGER